MKKYSIIIISIMIAGASLWNGCKKESIKNPPTANFNSNVTNIIVGQSVNFTDLSTGNPTSWSWTFDGGTPNTSNAANPIVQYNTAGVYSVTLTAINADGTNTITKDNFITVTNPLPTTNLTFNNKIFTPIIVTCNNETQTIAVGGSVSYAITGTSVNYTASTKGTTSSGSLIGLEMTWANSVTLSGSSQSLDLITSSSYFFLKIQNSGYSTLTDLWVNKDLASELNYPTVTFPWSSTSSPTYETGYFRAWTNSNIKISYVPADGLTYYYYLLQGTTYSSPFTGNFTLPFTENQSKTLNFTPQYKSLIEETTSIPLTPGAIPQYAKE